MRDELHQLRAGGEPVARRSRPQFAFKLHHHADRLGQLYRGHVQAFVKARLTAQPRLDVKQHLIAG